MESTIEAAAEHIARNCTRAMKPNYITPEFVVAVLTAHPDAPPQPCEKVRRDIEVIDNAAEIASLVRWLLVEGRRGV